MVRPSSWPPAVVTMTVLPTSAVPLSALPLLGATVGAAGGAASMRMLATALALPEASWAITSIRVPSARGGLGVKVQLPSGPVVAWPISTLLA